MLFMHVCVLSLHNSTLIQVKEDVALASFIQNPVVIATIAICQGQGCGGVERGTSTITFEVGEPSPSRARVVASLCLTG